MFLTPSRIVLAIAIVACVSAVQARAQAVYVYDFLHNDASARAAGMGGAFVTIANDPSGMYYNPATLNSVDSTQASFTFFKHLLDINSGSATIATSLEGVGKVGFGVSYTNYGSFDRTDRAGQLNGTFGSNDIVAVVGWGTELGEGFAAGINGKAIFSTIDSYGSAALALDGGLHYMDTANRVQAGLALLNLGSQVSSFGADNERLPLDLKIGASHQLRGLPLLVAVNFSRLLDETDDFLSRFSSFSVGGEFTLSKPLRVRVGYNNRVRQDVAFGQSKGLAGFSAGLGVAVKGYRFDYAFNSLDRLGGNHRVTVNASF